MKMLKWVGTLIATAFIAGCGGGGGSAGSSSFGSGSGSGTGAGGGGTGATASYNMAVVVQRTGVSTTQISSTETVQAVATVTASDGSAVEGIVVSFSASGSLLKFAPLAATALTNSAGKATLDLSASSSANTGATTVQATAAVGAVAVAGSRSIEITAGVPASGGSPVPAAINFIGSMPASTAIVIKGAGGNGRSESAILTFRIVDASNAPINAATVDLTINTDNGGAEIATDSAVSNSDGLVNVTVSSGASPASIVVTAASNEVSTVSSQSDSLLVSNSVPVSGGFEIVAETYNLDGRKTGDSTTISAYVVDEFGNPVPDGVAVSFQTDFGAVASSTLGGCATVNGICTVGFRVQEPRGTGIATVAASVRVGTGNVLAQTLQINMAGATGTPYLALEDDATTTLTQLTLTSCKQAFELFLSDGNGHSTAAGTTIAAPFASTGVTATVKTGSPVLDQLEAGFPPTGFGLELDLTGTTLVPVCNPAGVVANSPAFFQLKFTSSGGIVFTQRVGLAYPQ